MGAKLIITIEKDYPNDFNLTGYEGCDTVVEAAKLDKELMETGEFASFDEFIEGRGITVSYRVLGDA